MTDFCLKFLGFNNYQWSADSLSWWGLRQIGMKGQTKKNYFGSAGVVVYKDIQDLFRLQ